MHACIQLWKTLAVAEAVEILSRSLIFFFLQIRVQEEFFTGFLYCPDSISQSYLMVSCSYSFHSTHLSAGNKV